jgi:hypothetical protein
MKKLPLLLVILCFANTTFSQSAFQYFDGDDTIANNTIEINIDTSAGNIWQIGPPNKIVFNSAATLPNALVTDTINTYPINNKSSFIIGVRNYFVGSPNVLLALQWMQKLDLDSNYDGGVIEFSIDTGKTWQNAFDNPLVYKYYGYLPENKDTLNNGYVAFSGTDTSWRNVWLCFYGFAAPQVINTDSILYRFTFLSDSINNNKDGWMIDNMRFTKTMSHTLKQSVINNKLLVYPNPANEIIQIEFENNTTIQLIKTIELFNEQGQIVGSWSNLPTKTFIETNNYSAGKYYLKVITNSSTETIPVIIEHPY